MRLLTLGLNHRTAPVEVRERVSFSREELRSGLVNLGEYDGLSGLVVLSTCNRTEFYAAVEDHERGAEALRQFLNDLTQGGQDLDEYLYTYTDEEAVTHLFRVAASLDSLVLGEGQILSQVKEAYAIAREAGATSTVLNLLFHRAIAVGKRVRTETRIAYRSVSVSYTAVELAASSLGGLGGCSALIFGAGKMAELTAEHLRAHGIETIYVANRHLDRAARLAERIGGTAIPFDRAMECAVGVDVIVTSTGAPHYVVKAWEARRLMARRHGKKIFFIDIAVPRDVDPDVTSIKGVELYNIDALEAVVDEHLSERQTEAVKAERIVREEVASLAKGADAGEVRRNTEALHAYQKRKETEKETACIPYILPSDLKKKVEPIATDVSSCLGADGSEVALFVNREATGGIVYIDVCYPADALPIGAYP
ncbi:MAG: glutamyl-tRNA reductase, partial [Selenomonas artemidis]